MERRFLLQSLYDNINDKSRILLNKRVSRIEQGHDGITVYCQDGTEYEGDVVVGADGVHSAVRGEMWRHMSVEHASLVESEKTGEGSLLSGSISSNRQSNDLLVQGNLCHLKDDGGACRQHLKSGRGIWSINALYY